jgi:peptide/nickel transport system ATP-binding protein
MTAPLLEIQHLTVESVAERLPIVRDVNLRVMRGEVLALIGESGSGKTTVCLATLGHTRPGLHITAGQVRLEGIDLLSLSTEALRSLRGRRVAYVAQSASASFNPSLPLGEQVIEPAKVHHVMERSAAQARSVAMYRELALPEPERIGARYPHQVSGGQLQRLMAAMAMCCGPELLVLDEPTTSLDVTTQMGVLKSFKDAIRQHGVAALYVSHDLAVVAQLADRIVVLRDGMVQETGSTTQILTRPAAPYTRALIDAWRHWTPGSVSSPIIDSAQRPPLLQLSGLTAGYGRNRAGAPAVVAVKSVELAMHRSSVVGVIGESGSGKSTLARVIAGLLPPASGTIILDGQPLAPLAADRPKPVLQRIQLVFQSPDVALNPAHRIGKLIGRPLEYFHGLRSGSQSKRVAELLELVQLPADFATRLPHELSGGQKQRVNLARALAAEPDLILCDEVTSALDTVVAASIMDLLRQLKTKRDLAFLFITHDVSMAATFAEELLVMYHGEIVERGPTDRVLNTPEHPYTRLLVASVPELRSGWLESAFDERARFLRGEGPIATANHDAKDGSRADIVTPSITSS